MRGAAKRGALPRVAVRGVFIAGRNAGFSLAGTPQCCSLHLFRNLLAVDEVVLDDCPPLQGGITA
jgi:hypothetical protein